ncbi:acylphosphatase [Candidatus Woesearchaeota archaeon]|nr:acylphosphatase [Candidatus Woesearchaeota archaeon]
MPKSRIHLIIKGRVQGVFFRANTQKHAEKLNLEGWVKNLPDGNVEVVAEGEKEKIKDFISFCRKGPSSARVDDIDIRWEDYTGEFKSFSIRY